MSRIILPDNVPVIGRPKLEEFPHMSSKEIDDMANGIFSSYEKGTPGAVPISIPLGAFVRVVKTMLAQRVLLAIVATANTPALEGAEAPGLSPDDLGAIKRLLASPDLNAADTQRFHAGV